jgi:O-antigen ligase
MDTEYEINRARQAHNMWIQRGGETGIVGLAILIWFIASVPVDAFRVRRWLTALRARGAIDEDTHEHAHQLSLCVDGLMVPFLLTGFFLSMEDFEALYLVAMLTGCLTTWVRRVRDAADASDRERERAWQAGADAPRAQNPVRGPTALAPRPGRPG